MTAQIAHRYRLKYDLKHEAGIFKKEELGTEGGTDALLIGSILFPHDGSYSQDFTSVDGRNKGKPLSDHDLFKFWILMGAKLGEPDRVSDLDEGRKMYAFLTARKFFDSLQREPRKP
jgi:hypothetical protein